jgi:hypothetical protein
MQWRLPYFLHVAVCLNSKLRQRQLGFDQARWIRVASFAGPKVDGRKL